MFISKQHSLQICTHDQGCKFFAGIAKFANLSYLYEFNVFPWLPRIWQFHPNIHHQSSKILHAIHQYHHDVLV